MSIYQKNATNTIICEAIGALLAILWFHFTGQAILIFVAGLYLIMASLVGMVWGALMTTVILSTPPPPPTKDVSTPLSTAKTRSRHGCTRIG